MSVEIKDENLINPSIKLQKYLENIERETGRQIQFLFSPSYLGNNRPRAAFDLFPPDGVMIILYNIEGEYEERMIAHEATHGYLIFKEGYCRITSALRAYLKDEITTFLNSMISDIVVNKKLEDKGFSPYSITHIPYLKEKIRELRKNIDFYAAKFNDDEIKNKGITVDYVVHWGFLKYYNLRVRDKNIFENFNKLLQENFPDQVETALKIINTIEKCGIFTSEGYERVIRKLVNIWELGNLVQIV